MCPCLLEGSLHSSTRPTLLRLPKTFKMRESSTPGPYILRKLVLALLRSHRHQGPGLRSSTVSNPLEMCQSGRGRAGVLSAMAYHHAVSVASSLGKRKLRSSHFAPAVCWEASVQQFKKRRCVMPFCASSSGMLRDVLGFEFHPVSWTEGQGLHVTGEYCRQAK